MVFAIYKYQEVIVMLREIEKVLEEDVRPYLLEHEGNVRISEYKEGILKVRMSIRSPDNRRIDCRSGEKENT